MLYISIIYLNTLRKFVITLPFFSCFFWVLSLVVGRCLFLFFSWDIFHQTLFSSVFLTSQTSIGLSILFLWFSIGGPLRRQNPQDYKFAIFCQLLSSLVFYPGFGDMFVFRDLREFYVSHFRGQILVYTYAIWLYGQISISFTIPSGVG